MRFATEGSSALAVLTVGTATPLPSLDALAANPSLAAGLAPEVARALLARLVVAQAALLPALLAPAAG